MSILKEQRDELIKLAIKRDGRQCWLCAGRFEPCGPLSLTLEHLTPRSHGGSDDHSNIFLAHQKCNVLLGDMSRREKLRFRRGILVGVRPPPLPAWHKSYKSAPQ